MKKKSPSKIRQDPSLSKHTPSPPNPLREDAAHPPSMTSRVTSAKVHLYEDIRLPGTAAADATPSVTPPKTHLPEDKPYASIMLPRVTPPKVHLYEDVGLPGAAATPPPPAPPKTAHFQDDVQQQGSSAPAVPSKRSPREGANQQTTVSPPSPQRTSRREILRNFGALPPSPPAPPVPSHRESSKLLAAATSPQSPPKASGRDDDYSSSTSASLLKKLSTPGSRLTMDVEVLIPKEVDSYEDELLCRFQSLEDIIDVRRALIHRNPLTRLDSKIRTDARLGKYLSMHGLYFTFRKIVELYGRTKKDVVALLCARKRRVSSQFDGQAGEMHCEACGRDVRWYCTSNSESITHAKGNVCVFTELCESTGGCWSADVYYPSDRLEF